MWLVRSILGTCLPESNFQQQETLLQSSTDPHSVSHDNPLLARLQARSFQIPVEDAARKQQQHARMLKLVDEVLYEIREVVKSQRARDIVMRTGCLNLHIWNSRNPLYEEDTLSFSFSEIVSEFDLLTEAVKAEVLPYKSENSTREGRLTGHIFYLINFAQEAQLDREGNLTLSEPITYHKNHQTVVGQALAKLEDAYLGLKKTNNSFNDFKMAFEKNTSKRGESIGDRISRCMGNNRAVVLRININNPLKDRKINKQFPVLSYHVNVYSIRELAEFVNSVKNYARVPVRCSYNQKNENGYYLTDSVKLGYQDTELLPMTIDLIFPSGKETVLEEEVYPTIE